MWYAITGVAGLLLGVGFLIWALNERSARHKAERAADEATASEQLARRRARANATAAAAANQFAKNLNDQVSALRGRLDEARTRLAQCGDPEAIKDWLDAELAAEEL